MVFEVGESLASFQDVNLKELRLAELSRLDQMLINTCEPCSSCSANANAASLGKVGKDKPWLLVKVFSGGWLPRQRGHFGW